MLYTVFALTDAYKSAGQRKCTAQHKDMHDLNVSREEPDKRSGAVGKPVFSIDDPKKWLEPWACPTQYGHEAEMEDWTKIAVK